MKTLRILSIDFDYFQQVNGSTLKTCYPDGYDMPSQISSLIWKNKYEQFHDRIMNVTINNFELAELEQILKRNCKEEIPVLITNSHIHIYQFIKKYMTGMDKVHITNIDMHHDFGNENTDLDCGNWISHIAMEYPNISLTWICNKTSIAMYDLDEVMMNQVLTSVRDIGEKQYDLVFLCRSDPWTPPHLDIYFEQLKKCMCDHFSNMTIENQVQMPRIASIYQKYYGNNFLNRN